MHHPIRRLLQWPALIPVLLIATTAFSQSMLEREVPAERPASDVTYELAWHDQPKLLPSSSSRKEFAQSETETLPSEAASGEQSVGDYDLAVGCCPDELKHGLYAFYGYESFRGIQDDGWGNNGLHVGVNYGTRLGPISDWTGFGLQIGGSVGVYNWNGTDYHLDDQDKPTTQGFLTYGFFRTADQDNNWSAAIVQDWMFTDNFGIFAENPTLAQCRGQIGYAVGPWNEFGLWGTFRGWGDTRDVPGIGSTTWRPVQQLLFYWQHKWGPGAPDTRMWFGVPEHDRLAGGGSLGDYLVGASANCPLGDRVSIYTLITYMHPSAGLGPPGSSDEAWDFSIGLAFYPAANSRTRTLSDRIWMPQLPVANNGYFLVDTNKTY